MTEQTWPKDNYSHGTNEWEHDIGAFAKLLQETDKGLCLHCRGFEPPQFTYAERIKTPHGVVELEPTEVVGWEHELGT